VIAEHPSPELPEPFDCAQGRLRPGLHDLSYLDNKKRGLVGRVVILSLVLFYQFGGGEVDIFGEIYLACRVRVRGNWGGLGA
jgi:hypothetical protein